MTITQVHIRRIFPREETKLRAIVSITFDEGLAIHDIKVIETNNRFFVAMPSRKTEDGRHLDIVHPIAKELRQEIEQAILAAYMARVEWPEQTGEEEVHAG